MKHLTSRAALACIPITLLLTVTVILFAPGMTTAFSSDDYVHLNFNTDFADLLDASQVFSATWGREYRPLVRISLWLNHLMGDTALPYKLTNLALHCLSSIFVYLLLFRFHLGRTAAFIGCVIFALHPIHVTSIQFILGRTDLLASVFYLATLLLVTQWNDRPGAFYYSLTLLAFVATFLTKELAVTLPALMLLTSCLRNKTISLKHIIKTIILLLPFGVITLFYLLVRIYLWSVDPDAVAVYTNFSAQHVALNYVQWAFALVYPLDLYQAQNWFIANPVAFLICAISLLFSVLLYVTLPSWRTIIKSKALWIGGLWIVLTLIPMVGSGAHRWYLYLPSVGLSLIAAALYSSTVYKNRLLVVVAIFSVMCAAETWRESLDWRSQSVITSNFLQQVEHLRLYEHDELVFINMPFGYRGSFLFTHKSLYFAMCEKYGRAPTIHALTYLNLDTHTQMRVSSGPAELTFELIPSAHGYVMFTASKRRFAPSDSTIHKGYSVSVDSVNEQKQITRYRIALPDTGDIPVYYFDGKHIIRHR